MDARPHLRTALELFQRLALSPLGRAGAPSCGRAERRRAAAIPPPAISFRLAVEVEHGLSEGVQPCLLDGSEDVLVGLLGGTKASAQLPRAGGCQVDTAAPPVVRIDLPSGPVLGYRPGLGTKLCR